MKIEFMTGPSLLRLTSENTRDIVDLGRLVERTGSRCYELGGANTNQRAMEIEISKVLKLMLGEKP